MNKLLVFSNPSHMGIRLVADAYRKVFEEMGMDFDFFNFPEIPRCSIEEANMLVQWKMNNTNADNVIFFQPSYFNASTVSVLSGPKFKENMNIFCINTEDPYSTYPFLQMNEIFKRKFTNEKVIADRYKTIGYIYLPLAVDSNSIYKNTFSKSIDVSYICTFYQNRIEYLNQLMNIDCKKFIAGNVGHSDSVIDLTQFNRMPGVTPHHIELMTYANSYLALNPHRLADNTGKSYLYDADGVKCPTVMPKAVSPNPRFFDAIDTWCIPMCNRERSECVNLMIKNKMDEKIANRFILPDSSELVEKLPDQLAKVKKFYKDGGSEALFIKFRENETYHHRVGILLKEINSI